MPESRDSVASVLAVRDAWVAALKSRDVDRLLDLLSDDVVMMHPNGRTDVGKAAVRADFERFFKQFTVDQKGVSDETVVSGDWAFDRGRVRTTILPVGGGNPVEVASEVVTILRREANGAWKIARVIAVLR
jgi:uncharacterized protein (TIGR02246 family)